jgi:hypothetical protein
LQNRRKTVFRTGSELNSVIMAGGWALMVQLFDNKSAIMTFIAIALGLDIIGTLVTPEIRRGQATDADIRDRRPRHAQKARGG